jgi:TRAP-type C4-dicarboxylate transport system substrate-binding protein
MLNTHHRRFNLPTVARGLVAALSTVAALGTASATDLILPSEVAVTHWKTGYMNEFAEAVKAKTKGALNVKVFPASQLYNDKDGMAALGTGAVHMVWPVTVRLESIDPRTGTLNLPFGLTDQSMMNTCYKQGVVKLISSYVEPRGLQVLGFLRAADLVFVMRDKEVKRLEDMKGTKIRVIGGKVLLDTIRSFDASPVSMPASEMSTAMSQGAIDGAFTSLGGWTDMIGATGKVGWYVPGMSVAAYAVVVDKNWLKELPAGHSAAVTEAIADIATRQWKEAIDADQDLIKKVKAQGSSFTVADAAEVARWRSKAHASSASFVEKYPDVTEKMSALEKQCGLAR